MPEIIKWRVMLKGEDGKYCLEDGMTESNAAIYADSVAGNYGEGQEVYMEKYQSDIYV